ncbi:hypothetical protein [Microbacterium sp. bgisy189]|uniref:hypothetical protein n=1 Tax=Microbacterium sp. bgisy189 TaxID=3413798 RepID=UPI003EB74C56
MRYIVHDHTSLESLAQRRLPAGTDAIELGGILSDRRIERDLNRHYAACGCTQGSAAVMATLAISVVGAIATGFSAPFAWWQVLLYLAGAALVGKGAGLVWSRSRMRVLVRSLRRRLAAASPSEVAVSALG